MAGAVVVAAGYIVGFFAMQAVCPLVAVSSIVGAGVGLAYEQCRHRSWARFHPSESGSANGLNSLIRSVGTSLSAAVAGLVFAQLSTDLAGAPVPSRQAFRVGNAGKLGSGQHG